MKDFIEKLKSYLRENQGSFVECNSWMGDTERGFYTETLFSMDDLEKEIDEFSKTFQANK